MNILTVIPSSVDLVDLAVEQVIFKSLRHTNVFNKKFVFIQANYIWCHSFGWTCWCEFLSHCHILADLRVVAPGLSQSKILYFHAVWGKIGQVIVCPVPPPPPSLEDRLAHLGNPGSATVSYLLQKAVSKTVELFSETFRY